MTDDGQHLVRRLGRLAALAGGAALLAATNAHGALISGPLPAATFTYASVLENTVSISGGGVSAADIVALEGYVRKLSAVSNPTVAQRAALATYQARLVDYEARYAASIDLRAGKSANVKTTYSRVPPSATYEAGWHSHNGPVVVTVTVGTLTLYDSSCREIDVSAGQSYIESPKQVLNARALPARNPGVETVEWATTRLYPSGTIDPVPASAPCTP